MLEGGPPIYTDNHSKDLLKNGGCAIESCDIINGKKTHDKKEKKHNEHATLDAKLKLEIEFVENYDT